MDAEKAYLAYASVSGLGVRLFNIVEDQPTYDLRYAALSSKDAKHVADVIWWLRRVRTWTAFEDSSRRDVVLFGGRPRGIAASFTLAAWK